MKHLHSITATLCGLLALAASVRAEPPAWEPSLRESLSQMASRLNDTLKPWPVPNRVFRIADYGAIGDGQTVNTKSIQKAIDACSASGGGVVRVENGEFVTGTIDLRSGVMLEIAKGAKLLGSTSLADYPDRIPKRPTVMDSNMKLKQSLIYAERCERIGIRGEGEIDGRGTRKFFPGRVSNDELRGRPFLMRIIECKQVVMDGITLRNSAAWMENYLACEDVILQNMKVENISNVNNDGADIDGCRNVIVRDCFMNSEDDGLCFKGASMRPLENVLVENSTFYSTCNAIKFGTDSQGGFRNVLIRNVTIGGPPKDLPVYKPSLGISGIALQAVDGGATENIWITDVRMDRTQSPFCLRLGDRGRVMPGMKKPEPGALRHIILEHISGSDHGIRGSIISGIPGATIQDVLFSDVKLTVAGGGRRQDADRVVPEIIDAYPDAFSFGKTVPAWAFWIRHAQRITFDKVAIVSAKPDARPAFDAKLDTDQILLNGEPLR